ncbi:TfoX/Sxy family protein [Celeribacter arenosi]
MSITPEMIARAEDLFAPLGQITTRKMMGGLAIYHAGTIFASLDSEGAVYLKAKGPFAAELEAAGARQFITPRGPMGYWTVPDDALDDPEMASDWGRRALAAL